MIGYGTGKINLKLAPFCQLNCLAFLFSYEFPAVELRFLIEIQKGSNFKIIFPVLLNPILYNSALIYKKCFLYDFFENMNIVPSFLNQISHAKVVYCKLKEV